MWQLALLYSTHFLPMSPPGVRFPEDSVDDIQKQKQLLKDAAAFLVSCQIPSLVSFRATTWYHAQAVIAFTIFQTIFLYHCITSLCVCLAICGLVFPWLFFLVCVVINFSYACLSLQVKDCLDHSALPMDGATLTEALHQRGINVRYLGNVLEFVDKTPAKAQLEHFYVSLNP